MNRTLAIGSLVAVAALGLAGCSTVNTPAPQSSEIPTVGVQPTPAPSPSMTAVDGAVVPVQTAEPVPVRSAVTIADNDGVVEMQVENYLPITGLVPDDLHHAAFVTSSRDDIVQVQQRVISDKGKQSDPELYGLAPGVSHITVYDTDPGGNGQTKVFSFTVHVQDATGAAMIQGLTGVVAEIAAGGMREGEAVNAAQDAGYEVRYASVNGEVQPMSKDYNAKRLNFVVNDGIVTSLTVG